MKWGIMGNEQINGFFQKNEAVLSWTVKILLVLGVAGLYWMRVEFVSKEEYVRDRETDNIDKININKQFSDIRESLIKIDAKFEHDLRQDQTLNDHETRIRNLERNERVVQNGK